MGVVLGVAAIIILMAAVAAFAVYLFRRSA